MREIRTSGATRGGGVTLVTSPLLYWPSLIVNRAKPYTEPLMPQTAPFGFLRVAAASVPVTVGDPARNLTEYSTSSSAPASRAFRSWCFPSSR